MRSPEWKKNRPTTNPIKCGRVFRIFSNPITLQNRVSLLPNNKPIWPTFFTVHGSIKRSQNMLGSVGWTKKRWWWLIHDDLILKTAVLSSQTIHACFAVAFRTQAPNRFVTGEYHRMPVWTCLVSSRQSSRSRIALYSRPFCSLPDSQSLFALRKKKIEKPREEAACGQVNLIWIRCVWTGKLSNPERKTCGFKIIRIRVDGALLALFTVNLVVREAVTWGNKLVHYGLSMKMAGNTPT